MAYNPLFPMGYQPAYQPQQQAQNNGRIYVQGEAGAKSYLIAPNTSVVLWDTESPTIYIKAADATGMPTMRIYDYKERGVEEVPKVEYATKEDIDALREELEKLKGAKK